MAIFRKRKIAQFDSDVRTVNFVLIVLRPTLSNDGRMMRDHYHQPVFLAGGREGLGSSFSIAERKIFCCAMA